MRTYKYKYTKVVLCGITLVVYTVCIQRIKVHFCPYYSSKGMFFLLI